jgi:RNA polymerase sigma-70 factor (ECF subfamily)
LNSYEDAVDVTQISFLKAFQGLDSYDPDRKFFSWLYRIQMNETLNWLKRRRPAVDLPEDLLSSEPDPEEAYVRNEVAANVQAAILELPIPLRQVIVFRHIAGLSYQDIGDVLAIPTRTVKSRLFEARQKLRDILVRHGAVNA